MSDILKSRSFWTLVVGAVIGALALAVPELAPYKETIIEALLVIIGLIVGGFKVQDAIMASKGMSRYNSYTKAQ